MTNDCISVSAATSSEELVVNVSEYRLINSRMDGNYPFYTIRFEHPAKGGIFVDYRPCHDDGALESV